MRVRPILSVISVATLLGPATACHWIFGHNPYQTDIRPNDLRPGREDASQSADWREARSADATDTDGTHDALKTPDAAADLHRDGPSADIGITNVYALLGGASSPASCDGSNTAGGLAPYGVCTIIGTFNNKSSKTISNLMFVVITLTNGDLLLNADGAPGGVGAKLTVPATALGLDGKLTPSEIMTQTFSIGLVNPGAFVFKVDTFGHVE
jgi:hypothetical protein